MRDRELIQKDLADLDQQEQDLQAEIQAKTKELAEAKASNQALLKKYLGTSRRPVALSVQSEKIKTLEIEISQLREMAPMFGERRQELKTEARLCDAAAKLGEYNERARVWFAKLDEAMKILKDAAEGGRRLENIVSQLRNENPVHSLSSVFAGVDEIPEDDPDFEFNLGGYRFLNHVGPLEKELEHLVKAVKGLSDLAFGLAFTVLPNLRIPESKPIEKDPPRTAPPRSPGPVTKITRGRSDIENHPERYTQADLAKVGLKKKLPPPPMRQQIVNMA